jgi:hypothetical protein
MLQAIPDITFSMAPPAIQVSEGDALSGPGAVSAVTSSSSTSSGIPPGGDEVTTAGQVSSLLAKESSENDAQPVVGDTPINPVSSTS